MAYTTIDKPTDYFNTVLYTGNTTDDRTISGVGFQPDWNWTKNRSSAQNHWLADSVRGSTKIIRSDTTNAEVTAPSLGSIASFNSDGYVLQAGSSNDNNYNTENNNYVSWNWLAGGTASSNTDGSTTSTVSANTTSGFSIGTYTGTSASATIGHSLGTSPSMVIIKRTDSAENWRVHHVGLTSLTYRLALDTTEAEHDETTFGLQSWNSSTFTLGSGGSYNVSGGSFVFYAFAEKKGFSKAFSYTGNGSSDGSFCYLGFRPAWIMIKRTDTTSDWSMYDIKREESNPQYEFDLQLKANSNLAEGSNGQLGFHSNGFKLRSSDTFLNASGGSYIGFAIAENPFVTSTKIPTTAR